MQLKIRNFRGISKADLELHENVTILAGTNGEGKSSCMLALAALFQAQPVVLDNIDKKDAARFVHKGMKSGTIELRTDSGSRKYEYPSCEAETEGTPPTANALAVGRMSLMAFDLKARGAMLTRVLDSTPKREELEERLAEAAKMTPEQIKTICDYVYGTSKDPARGFDGAHEWQKDEAKQLKGRYEAKTGVKWYPKKSLSWTPEGWELDLADKKQEQLEEAIVNAKGAHELAVAANAVSAVKRAELQELADRIPELSQRLKESQVAQEEAKQEHQELANKQLEKIPGPAETQPRYECPGCGCLLVMEGGRLIHGEEAKGISLEQLAEIRDRRTAHKQAQEAALAKLESAIATNRKVQDELYKAEQAAAQLLNFKEAENPVDAEDVVAARAAVQRAEKRLKCWQQYQAGKRIHVEIEQTLDAVAVLAPDGLRHECLVKKLDEFNAFLATLWQPAEFKRIEITPTLDAMHDGDSYTYDCSDGERLRVDFVLRVALAMKQSQPIVLLDRAELLDKAGLKGVMRIAKFSGIPCVVALKADMRDGKPDVPLLGNTYWLTAGTAQRLTREAVKAG